MSASLVGVVYDSQTLAVRRIIVPDKDAEVLDGRHLGAGEAMATSPSFMGKDIVAAMNAVALKTGRIPPRMQDVHFADSISRGMNGGKLSVR